MYDATAVKRLQDALDSDPELEENYNAHVRLMAEKKKRNPSTLIAYARDRDPHDARFYFVPVQWHNDYNEAVLRGVRMNKAKAVPMTFREFVVSRSAPSHCDTPQPSSCHDHAGSYPSQAKDTKLRKEYLYPVEKLAKGDARFKESITLTGKRKLLSMMEWAKRRIRSDVFVQDIRTDLSAPSPSRLKEGMAATADEEGAEELHQFLEAYRNYRVPAMDSLGNVWPDYLEEDGLEDDDDEEGLKDYVSVPLPELLRDPGHYEVHPEWRDNVAGLYEDLNGIPVVDSANGSVVSLLTAMRRGGDIESRYRLLSAASDGGAGVAANKGEGEEEEEEEGEEEEEEGEGDDERADEEEDEDDEEEEEGYVFKEQETCAGDPHDGATPALCPVGTNPYAGGPLVRLRRAGDNDTSIMPMGRFQKGGDSLTMEWNKLSLAIWIDGVEGDEFYRCKPIPAGPLPTRASFFTRLRQNLAGRFGDTFLPEVGEFPGGDRTWEDFVILFEDVYTPVGFSSGRRFSGKGSRLAKPDDRIAELKDSDRRFLLRGLITMVKAVGDNVVDVEPGSFDFGREIEHLAMTLEDDPETERILASAGKSCGCRLDGPWGRRGGDDKDRCLPARTKDGPGNLDPSSADFAGSMPIGDALLDRRRQRLEDQWIRSYLSNPEHDEAMRHLEALPTRAPSKRRRDATPVGASSSSSPPDALSELDSADSTMPVSPEDMAPGKWGPWDDVMAQEAEIDKRLLEQDRSSCAFWDRLRTFDEDELHETVERVDGSGEKERVLRPLLVLCPRGPSIGDVEPILDEWRKYVFAFGPAEKVLFLRSNMFSHVQGIQHGGNRLLQQQQRGKKAKRATPARGGRELLLKNLNGDLINLRSLDIGDKETVLNDLVVYAIDTWGGDAPDPDPYLVPIRDVVDGAVYTDYQPVFGIFPIKDYLLHAPGLAGMDRADYGLSEKALSHAASGDPESFGWYEDVLTDHAEPFLLDVKGNTRPLLVLLPTASAIKRYGARTLMKHWDSFVFPFSRSDRSLFMRAMVSSNKKEGKTASWYLINLAGFLVDLRVVHYANLFTVRRLFDDVLNRQWDNEQVEARVRGPLFVLVDDVSGILDVDASAATKKDA